MTMKLYHQRSQSKYRRSLRGKPQGIPKLEDGEMRRNQLGSLRRNGPSDKTRTRENGALTVN